MPEDKSIIGVLGTIADTVNSGKDTKARARLAKRAKPAPEKKLEFSFSDPLQGIDLDKSFKKASDPGRAFLKTERQASAQPEELPHEIKNLGFGFDQVTDEPHFGSQDQYKRSPAEESARIQSQFLAPKTQTAKRAEEPGNFAWAMAQVDKALGTSPTLGYTNDPERAALRSKVAELLDIEGQVDPRKLTSLLFEHTARTHQGDPNAWSRVLGRTDLAKFQKPLDQGVATPLAFGQELGEIGKGLTDVVAQGYGATPEGLQEARKTQVGRLTDGVVALATYVALPASAGRFVIGGSAGQVMTELDMQQARKNPVGAMLKAASAVPQLAPVAQAVERQMKGEADWVDWTLATLGTAAAVYPFAHEPIREYKALRETAKRMQEMFPELTPEQALRFTKAGAKIGKMVARQDVEGVKNFAEKNKGSLKDVWEAIRGRFQAEPTNTYTPVPELPAKPGQTAEPTSPATGPIAPEPPVTPDTPASRTPEQLARDLGADGEVTIFKHEGGTDLSFVQRLLSTGEYQAEQTPTGDLRVYRVAPAAQPDQQSEPQVQPEQESTPAEPEKTADQNNVTEDLPAKEGKTESQSPKLGAPLELVADAPKPKRAQSFRSATDPSFIDHTKDWEKSTEEDHDTPAVVGYGMQKVSAFGHEIERGTDKTSGNPVYRVKHPDGTFTYIGEVDPANETLRIDDSITDWMAKKYRELEHAPNPEVIDWVEWFVQHQAKTLKNESYAKQELEDFRKAATDGETFSSAYLGERLEDWGLPDPIAKRYYSALAREVSVKQPPAQELADSQVTPTTVEPEATSETTPASEQPKEESYNDKRQKLIDRFNRFYVATVEGRDSSDFEWTARELADVVLTGKDPKGHMGNSVYRDMVNKAKADLAKTKAPNTAHNEPRSNKPADESGNEPPTVVMPETRIDEPAWWRTLTTAGKADKLTPLGLKKSQLKTTWNNLDPEVQKALDNQWGHGSKGDFEANDRVTLLDDNKNKVSGYVDGDPVSNSVVVEFESGYSYERKPGVFDSYRRLAFSKDTLLKKLLSHSKDKPSSQGKTEKDFVRGDDGNPVTFYHGTAYQFEKLGKSGAGTVGHGAYLTTDRTQAENYAQEAVTRGGKEGRVVTVHAKGDKWISTKAIGEYGIDSVFPDNGLTAEGKAKINGSVVDPRMEAGAWARLAKKAEAAGFDGIKDDYATHGDGYHLSVFDPANVVPAEDTPVSKAEDPYRHIVLDTSVPAVKGIIEDWRDLSPTGNWGDPDYAEKVKPGGQTLNIDTLARKTLRAFAAYKMLGDLHVYDDKTATFVIGGPGSGKSYATANFIRPHGVNIDPDDAKRFLPEYYTHTEDPGLTYQESNAIAYDAWHMAAESGASFIKQGTGADYERLNADIAYAKGAGFYVKIVFVEASPEVAQARVDKRVAEGGHGIPKDAILSKNKESRLSYERAIKERIADAFERWDTSGPRPERVDGSPNQEVAGVPGVGQGTGSGLQQGTEPSGSDESGSARSPEDIIAGANDPELEAALKLLSDALEDGSLQRPAKPSKRKPEGLSMPSSAPKMAGVKPEVADALWKVATFLHSKGFTERDALAEFMGTKAGSTGAMFVHAFYDQIAKDAAQTAQTTEKPKDNTSNDDTRSTVEPVLAPGGEEPSAPPVAETGTGKDGADPVTHQEGGGGSGTDVVYTDSSKGDPGTGGGDRTEGSGVPADGSRPAKDGEGGRTVDGRDGGRPDFRLAPVYADGSKPVIHPTTAGKTKDLVNAVKALHAAKERGYATPEEQAALIKFPGWGFSGNLLKPGTPSFNKELWDLLDKDTRITAWTATRNSHFTSPEVVSQIWSALEHLGFKGGDHEVLEPSAGTGLFFAAMPEQLRGGKWTMVEMEPTTGEVSKFLYPNQDVVISGYQNVKIPDGKYPLIVSNVPFDAPIGDATFFEKFDAQTAAALTSRSHNYFFAKAVLNARPGGIISFITSKGTMDNTKDAVAVREWLAKETEFLGAVRLPRTAFNASANTEVVTDVIFLRRRGHGGPEIETPWLETKQVDVHLDPENPSKGKLKYNLNEYFVANPHMVLGKNAMAGTMRQKNEYTVLPKTHKSLANQIKDAVKNLPQDAFVPVEGWKPPAVSDIPVPIGTRLGEAWRDGDKVMKLSATGSVVELTDKELMRGGVAGSGKVERNRKVFHDYFKVKDALREVMSLQSGNEADLKKAQASLAKAYESFKKKHGELHRNVTVERPLKDDAGNPVLDEDGTPVVEVDVRFVYKPLLWQDTQAVRVFSLEVWDTDELKVSKLSDVFTKRTVTMEQQVKDITDANDALNASLNVQGRVDLPWMAGVMGKTVEEVASELGDALYKTPDGEYEDAESYLSGQTRRKLAEAKKAYEAGDKSMARNIEALERNQPPDAEYTEVYAPMGASWMPADIVTDFVHSLVGRRSNWGDAPAYVVTNVKGTWIVDAGVRGSSAKESEWSAGGEFLTILRAALNDTPVKVYETDSDGHKYLNQERTDASNERVKAMQEQFTTWLDSEAKHQERVTKEYNDKVNVFVPKRARKVELTFPGLSPAVELREHRVAAVNRAMREKFLLWWHGVGSGKTFTAQMAAMKMKQTGLRNKPVFVAYKPTLEQVIADGYKAYPDANFLAAHQDSFTKGNREEFLSLMNTGDWDMVFISQEQLMSLPLSPQATHEIYDRLVDDETLNAGFDVTITKEELERLQSSRGDVTTKELARRILKLRQARDIAVEKAERQTSGLSFDTMGVDHVIVDEFHMYKGLEFSTRHTSLGLSVSQRALDLWAKMEYLRSHNGGATAMTGTALVNSGAEVYNIMRMLNPTALAEMGVSDFDAFASVFVRFGSKIEASVSGVFKLKERIRSFNNIGHLASMFSQVADVVPTTSVTSIKLPEFRDLEGNVTHKPIIVVTQPTDLQRNAFAEVLARFVAVKEKMSNGEMPGKGEDNYLSLSTLARLVSQDTRFYDPSHPAEPGSKLEAVAENVAKVYHKYAADKATQIVFMDFGVPTANTIDKGKFNAYADMIDRLVALGVKRSEIASITDAKTVAQRTMLAAKVNSGAIRVLIGSRPKLGVGMNVQAKLIAWHQVSLGWNPAMLEQARGRGVRFGNEWTEKGGVMEFLYINEASYDQVTANATMAKGNVFDQFMRAMEGYGKDVKEIEDLGDEEGTATMAEVAAVATGDTRILELVQASKDVDKAMNVVSMHSRKIASAESHAGMYLRMADEATARVAEEERLARAVVEAGLNADDVKIEVSGGTPEKVAEATQKLYRLADEKWSQGVIGKAGKADIVGGPSDNGGSQTVKVRLPDYAGYITLESWPRGDYSATWKNLNQELKKQVDRVLGASERTQQTIGEYRKSAEEYKEVAAKGVPEDAVMAVEKAAEAVKDLEFKTGVTVKGLEEGEVTGFGRSKVTHVDTDAKGKIRLIDPETGKRTDRTRDVRITGVNSYDWIRYEFDGHTTYVEPGSHLWFELAEPVKGALTEEGRAALEAGPEEDPAEAQAEEVAASLEEQAREAFFESERLRREANTGDRTDEKYDASLAASERYKELYQRVFHEVGPEAAYEMHDKFVAESKRADGREPLNRRRGGTRASTVAKRIEVSPLKGQGSKRLDQITLDLKRTFGGRQLTGSSQKGTLGQYLPKSKARLVRGTTDLDTLAHEVAHALDDRYDLMGEFKNDKATPFDSELFRPEFLETVDPSMPVWQQRAEAFAEFVRAWIVNPDEATALAPRLWAHIESKVPKVNVKIGGKVVQQDSLTALRRFGDDIRRFAGSEAVEQASASIAMDEDPVTDGVMNWLRRQIAKQDELGGYKTSFADVYRMLFTDFYGPAMSAFKETFARTGLDKKDQPKGLRPSENPVVLLRRISYADQAVSVGIREGLPDLDGTVSTGPVTGIFEGFDRSSKKAFKKDERDLAVFMFSQRQLHETEKEYERARVSVEKFKAHVMDVASRRLETAVGRIAKEASARLDAAKQGIADAANVAMVQAERANAPESVKRAIMDKAFKLDAKAERTFSKWRARQEAKAGKKLAEWVNAKVSAAHKYYNLKAAEKSLTKVLSTGGDIVDPNETARKAIAHLKSDPERFKMLERAAEKYREVGDWGLRFLNDAGVLSDEAVAAIRDQNPYWVSAMRSGVDVRDFVGSASGVASHKQVVKKFKGSERTLKNPFDSLLETVHAVTLEGWRNDTMRAWVDLLSVDRKMYEAGKPDTSDLAFRIPDGAKVPKGDEDKVFKVFRNGQPENWYVPDETLAWVLKNGLTGVKAPHPFFETLLNIASAPTTVLRNTITRMPSFAARNFVRDTAQRWVASTHKSRLLASFKPPGEGEYETYDRYGLGLGNLEQIEGRKGWDKARRHIETEMSGGKHVVLKYAGKAPQLYETLLEAAEKQNRLAEFRAAYKTATEELGYGQHDAALYAAHEARMLMVDFRRAGIVSKFLNRFIPFFNAGVQGQASFWNQAARDPWAVARKLAVYALIGLTLEQLYSMWTDSNDELRAMDPMRRDLYWNFKIGDDLWLSIPKGHEAGVLVSLVGRAVDQIRGQDPYALENTLGRLMRVMSPADDSDILGPLKTWYEIKSNYDSFRDKDIVPMWEADKKLDLRKGQKHSSPVGQALHGVAGMDARQWDYAIRSMFGNLGTAIVDASRVGGGDEPAYQFWAKQGGLFSTTPMYGNRDVQWVMRTCKENGIGSPSIKPLLDAYWEAKTPQERDETAREAVNTARDLRLEAESAAQGLSGEERADAYRSVLSGAKKDGGEGVPKRVDDEE